MGKLQRNLYEIYVVWDNIINYTIRKKGTGLENIKYYIQGCVKTSGYECSLLMPTSHIYSSTKLTGECCQNEDKETGTNRNIHPNLRVPSKLGDIIYIFY